MQGPNSLRLHSYLLFGFSSGGGNRVKELKMSNLQADFSRAHRRGLLPGRPCTEGEAEPYIRVQPTEDVSQTHAPNTTAPKGGGRGLPGPREQRARPGQRLSDRRGASLAEGSPERGQLTCFLEDAGEEGEEENHGSGDSRRTHPTKRARVK